MSLYSDLLFLHGHIADPRLARRAVDAGRAAACAGAPGSTPDRGAKTSRRAPHEPVQEPVVPRRPGVDRLAHRRGGRSLRPDLRQPRRVRAHVRQAGVDAAEARSIGASSRSRATHRAPAAWPACWRLRADAMKLQGRLARPRHAGGLRCAGSGTSPTARTATRPGVAPRSSAMQLFKSQGLHEPPRPAAKTYRDRGFGRRYGRRSDARLRPSRRQQRRRRRLRVRGRARHPAADGRLRPRGLIALATRRGCRRAQALKQEGPDIAGPSLHACAANRVSARRALPARR